MRKILAALAILMTPFFVQAQIITTVTGGTMATNLYTGENVQKLTASFFPRAVVKDSRGNVYVADYVDRATYGCPSSWTCNLIYSRIRKITPSGMVTTFAGGGMLYTDGIAATSAKINFPSALAVDKFDNIYYADIGRNNVRKISTAGIVTTVAGNDSAGYNGDGIVATTAKLNFPSGVSVDTSGNIFIADRFNNRIRKVTTSGIITTIAGTGTAGMTGNGGPATAAYLNEPSSVLADKKGNVFICDFSNYSIRKVNNSGVISAFAGGTGSGYTGDGGPATNASIYCQYGLATDREGRIIFSDDSQHYLRIIDTFGFIYTLSGTGTAAFSGDGGICTTASLHTPCGIFCDTGDKLLIADYNSQRIREIDETGNINTIAGNGNTFCDSMAATGTLFGPNCIYYDTVKKDLHIATGTISIGAGTLISNIFYDHVSKLKDNVMYSIAGDFIPDTSYWLGGIAGGIACNVPLEYANGICKNSLGELILVGNRRIYKIDSSKNLVLIAGNGGPGYGSDGVAAISTPINPIKVVCDKHDNIYFSQRNSIYKITSSGIMYRLAGFGATYTDGSPATAVSVEPTGFCIDTAGNIYLSEGTTSSVKKINASGIITTIAGTGSAGYSGDGGPATAAQLNYPMDVAIDRLGNLSIADIRDHRIRSINPAGVITTIAGTGAAGYSGDGGLADEADIDMPVSLSVGENNALYFADWTGVVRKISPPSVATANLASGRCGIYPNPNNGRFIIAPKYNMGNNCQIIIRNTLGQIIANWTTALNKPFEIDLKLVPGVYFISIANSSERIEDRFLVN